MSTTAISPKQDTFLSQKTRHRLWILLGLIAAAALCLALAVYGFDYYRLEMARRIASPKHPMLKPSGRIGHAIGMLAGVMFVLMFLYPLRKRWLWLSRKGTTKHWLDYHILMGLTAPMIITFHSSFKLHGIAGVAYWIMMMVVLSGIVGRYLYSLIPRRLDAAEMSFDEMRELSDQLAEKLHAQKVLPLEKTAPLFQLPSLDEVQKMPVLKALWIILSLDLKRSWYLLKLRRESGGLMASREMKEALSAVRKQTALSKNILFLSKMHQVFHLWHVIHRPFSYSFAILSILHVTVVLLLGY